MEKIKQIKLSDLKKHIQEQELEMNDAFLEDGSRTKTEHSRYKKTIKRMFDESVLNEAGFDSLFRGLDEIGFDYADASDYILRILVDANE